MRRGYTGTIGVESAVELEAWRNVVRRLEFVIETKRRQRELGNGINVVIEEELLSEAIVQGLHCHFCSHYPDSHQLRQVVTPDHLDETAMRIWDLMENGGCAYDVNQRPKRVIDELEAS